MFVVRRGGKQLIASFAFDSFNAYFAFDSFSYASFLPKVQLKKCLVSWEERTNSRVKFDYLVLVEIADFSIHFYSNVIIESHNRV